MRNLKMVVLGVLLFGIIGGTAFAQRVPLTIRASEGPAQVILSGRMIGMANPQLRVQIAPGTYDLLVRKPGLPAFRRKINVGSSGLTVQATLGATAKSSPPPPPPEPEPEPKPEPKPKPQPKPDPEPAPIPAQQEDSQPANQGVPVRFYWHAADTADIYINGRPIKTFNPNYETRRDEAPLDPFEMEGNIKNGDIITVGTRRGGSYGFMMVAVNRAGKLVLKTDRNWKWYEPATENVWFQPQAFQRSNNRQTVGVNPSPWGKQNDLVDEFGSDVKAIYSPDSSDRTAHLYYKVSLADSVSSNSRDQRSSSAAPEDSGEYERLEIGETVTVEMRPGSQTEFKYEFSADRKGDYKITAYQNSGGFFDDSEAVLYDQGGTQIAAPSASEVGNGYRVRLSKGTYRLHIKHMGGPATGMTRVEF